MNESILQFGTGRFLRGFVDLFVHELRQTDAAVGQVAVVQSTDSRRARLINDRGGRYHVAIRGLINGRTIDRTIEVTSIARAIVAAEDWPAALALARDDSLRTIVSNTTEAGYALAHESDAADAPPISFPAKLLRILQARFEADGRPLTILPCELLDDNADRLRQLVGEQADRWQVDRKLLEWMDSECRWCNTLVDRIVSAPKDDDPIAAEDPLMAVAEPFALWLIEGDLSGCELSAHTAVKNVDQLAPYGLRKVRILNGAHTALVAKAMPLGLETVRQAVADPRVAPWLESLLFEEIVPTIDERTDDAEAFARDVLERFANPFLDHRLADIALHQDAKIQTRLMPTVEEYRRQFGRSPKLLGEVVS